VPWFKFTTEHPESLRVSQAIQRGWPLLAARSDWPGDAAIFARFDLHNATTDYFITPALAAVAPAIVAEHGAVECEPPKRSRGIALLIGGDVAMRLLGSD
jgi:hypothetical protein